MTRLTPLLEQTGAKRIDEFRLVVTQIIAFSTAKKSAFVGERIHICNIPIFGPSRRRLSIKSGVDITVQVFYRIRQQVGWRLDYLTATFAHNCVVARPRSSVRSDVFSFSI